MEQDLAFALEGLGRGEEAVAHERAAIAYDPWLEAPWLALAARALENGSAEQAVHLAGVAVAIAPQDPDARQLLERVQAELSPKGGPHVEDRACGPAPAPRDADPAATTRWRTCQERRAGRHALEGAAAAGPLTDLARLDLAEGRPESAALLLTMAKSIGGGDAALLAKALVLSGNPCAAARASGADTVAAARGGGADADAATKVACAAVRSQRVLAEEDLRDDLAGLHDSERAIASSQLESLLGAGLDAPAAARRWRLDRRRGPRELRDLGGLTVRPGQEWYESHDPNGGGEREWRRRPGDAAIVIFAVRSGEAGAEAALARLLTSRRPAPLAWSPVSVASTDTVQTRSTALSVDADSGGRAEGFLWLAESAAAPGIGLVVAAFPGTAGLGTAGLEQSRLEIQEALAEAVLVPVRWSGLAVLDAGAGEEFPVPIAGGRLLPGDERVSPWRTYPAGEFTLALPPGAIAAPPAGAPARSAPRSPGALLWFRGRFRDRDGVEVAVGDEARAAGVAVLTAADDAQARARALGRGPQADPPLADPGAALISTLDVTKTLGAETGASAVSMSRFRPSTPGVEWLVCRLAFGRRLMEIDIPAVSGASSIALFWIPATARPVHGPPPPPPVDLSGRLGILFLRPPPSERRESFYKEGDLRSREFTMIVARGYSVVLDTVSPDAFPVRLAHEGGAAIVRLEKLPRSSAGDVSGSEALRGRLESSLRAWLAREGFALTGALVRSDAFKLSRSGAGTGLATTFTAVRDAVDADEGTKRAPSLPGSSPGDRKDAASGRATLLLSREGEGLIFLSLFWDAEAQQRAEEVELMMGSLRLLRQKTGAGS